MVGKVVEWLEGWAADKVQVASECAELKPGRMGVFRKGAACVQEYPDGAREEVHRFGIEICLWAQGRTEREENAQRVRGLEEWIREKDVAGELPEVDGECWRAEIVDGFSLKENTALESRYVGMLDLYVLRA